MAIQHIFSEYQTAQNELKRVDGDLTGAVQSHQELKAKAAQALAAFNSLDLLKMETHESFVAYYVALRDLRKVSQDLDKAVDSHSALTVKAEQALAAVDSLEGQFKSTIAQEVHRHGHDLASVLQLLKAEDYSGAYQRLTALYPVQVSQQKEEPTLKIETVQTHEITPTLEENLDADLLALRPNYVRLFTQPLKQVSHLAKQLSKIVTYPILGNADSETRKKIEDKWGKEYFDAEFTGGMSVAINVIGYMGGLYLYSNSTIGAMSIICGVSSEVGRLMFAHYDKTIGCSLPWYLGKTVCSSLLPAPKKHNPMVAAVE